ncbi:MAG: NADP-dependent isocitrate dehydrogenase [Planctomycetaceae bacterium]|nr:NADP-dependent isocitrate dehydrogenase [Planctomycetaceae bacterium]
MTSASSSPRRVTLIPGDGIGPEVVAAARSVVEAAGAPIEWEVVRAGREVFAEGNATGVSAAAIESLKRNGVALKGPLETPIGHGGKSANVTLRKFFETYGNTRPVRELPGIQTPFSGRGIDFVVVRENVEDLYAGIEHMQTATVAQCLKLVSEKGCEKISRLAFEVALSEGRRSVTCVTKANIMKLTEGMLKRVFERVASDYPDIEPRYMLVDNCAHQLVRHPESFDVLVTTNMNGDILSDLASGLVGGLGIAPGANIGRDLAMFEAVHGTAPDIAGRDMANPTAMLLSAVLMLRHLQMFELADRVEAAVLLTLERGPRTGDIAGGMEACGTAAFTDAIIGNLGRAPDGWKPRTHRPLHLPEVAEGPDRTPAERMRCVGIDVFVDSELSPQDLGASISNLMEGSPVRLKMISNRGTVVYPLTGAPTDCVDHWRCRFALREPGASFTDDLVLDVLARIAGRHRYMHLEKLCDLDGQRGYALAQGEE